MTKLDHPNEPGRWKKLEAAPSAALWRRERSDPFPVVQFYVIAPPAQTQVHYDEDRARAEFSSLTFGEA